MWNKGWDEVFKKYEWGKYPPEEVIRVIARNFFKVSDRSKVSILEVGCGTGANIWFLAREGFKSFGMDGSQVAVKRAQQRITKEKLSAQIIVGDATRLPYPDASFDAVLDVECIYSNSITDAKKIICEIFRVLKPGGIFFSKTFMEGTFRGALKKEYGLARFISKKNLPKLYTPFVIENLDYLIRSEQNGACEIKEWLITCRKLK